MSQNPTNHDQNIHTEPPTPHTENKAVPIPAGFARSVPVLLLALAVFLTLCFITQSTGAVGKFISGFLLGLFSYAAYILPLLIALHGVFYYADLYFGRRLSRLIFSIVTVVGISCLIYVIKYWGQDIPFDLAKYYTAGKAGAGLVGSTVAFCLMKLIGPIGVIILTVAVLAIYIIYFFGKGRNAFAILGLKLLGAITSFFAFFEKKILHIKKKGAEAKENKKNKAMRELGNELSDDEYFAVDNGMQELAIPELGILEVKSRRSLEENPTLHERVYPKSNAKENAQRSFRAAEAAAAVQDDPIRSEAASEKLRFDSRRDTGAERVIFDTPFTDARRTPYSEPKTEERAPAYTVDDNAESVFTKDFDPFNITLNTALASKKSSRAAEMESEGFKTEEDALPSTPEEAEKRLRAIEFEKKKKQLLEQRQRQFEAARAAAEKEKAATQTVAPEEDEKPPYRTAEAEPQRPTVTYAPEDAPAAPARTVLAEQAQGKTVELHEQMPTSFRDGVPRVEDQISTRVEKPQQAARAQEPPAYTPTQNPTYQNSYPPTTGNGYQNPYPSQNPMPTYADPYAQAPYAPVQNPAYAQPYPYTHNPYQPPVYGQPYGQNPYAPPAQAPYPPVQNPTYGQPYGQNPSPGGSAATAVPPESVTVPTAESAPRAAAATVSEFSTVQTAAGASDEQNPTFKPFTPTEAESIRTATPKEESLQMEREMIFSASEPIPAEELAADPQPIPEQEQNPQVLEYRNRFTFLREEEKENLYAQDMREEDATLNDGADEEEEADAPPFDNATDVSAAFNSFRQRETAPEPAVMAKELRPDYSDYKLPSLELLAKGGDEEDEGVLAEIQERQEKLIDALAAFNVTASIKGVDRGPRVTRYAVVPAKGIKSNAVTNLYEDICMALKAKDVRMENIPELSAIGFEIPNRKPQTVRLRDLIESEEFLSKTSKTAVCIGKDVTGNPVFGDIAKMPHVLVAGATGMGKSVCINAILISMLYKARPDELKLILIDPKKVEFNVYNGIPHLLIPVVTDPKQAAGALMWAVEQMEKRYDMIEKLCVRNIEAYNTKVRENPALGEPMSKIVIVIDELNDLMIQVRDPVENLIMSIAQKARAAGIHLIIGTQRPSVNVITGVIKANIPSRMSCKVSSAVDSRTILERAGAEKLLNNGDMLFHPVGLPEPIRVQGAFVADGEVEAVMDFLKKQTKGNSYDEQAIEEINRAAKKCSKKKDSGFDGDEDDDEDAGEGFLSDPKFLEAVDIAIKNQKIATSLIQRKLSIGYGKAAKYIDVMESLGIVGEANGPKPREVRITMDEWHEMLSRRSLD